VKIETLFICVERKTFSQHKHIRKPLKLFKLLTSQTMDRSRFNNILYAIQVLANHDLTGQSQEEAMPYLRAINSCVQSLLEVHWSDMGANQQQQQPQQQEPHLVEEEEDDDQTQVIRYDDDNMDISDTEEDAEDVDEEEEDDDVAEEEYAEYLAEAEYDADDMEVQHYTIPEDQRWADHLHPNVSARRPLPLDDDDDYIRATAIALSDAEMEMQCVQPCVYCEEIPNVADVYTTSCGHMLCKECYVHSQPYPFANIPHRCPACQTKSPQLFENRAQNQI
jgi:hypothetical protein